ncbi:MAG: class I SAM-dependent methyltransferase [Pseudomonadota bacterium]
MTEAPLRTDWTRRVAEGATPDADALRGHLRAIHRDHPGFTERCAGQCRDAQGRTTYDWLVEAVDVERHRSALDLGCGSGALLELCHARLPAGTRLAGLDMSRDELALAAARLPEGRADLHEGRAQSLAPFADASIDVVLCHWALTLMDPVAPVLSEVARILAPGGRFAALVDGPMERAPGYEAVHDLIYAHVQRELPDYGRLDLGDPRVRNSRDILLLAEAAFPGAERRCEPNVVSLTGPSAEVAREAAGFFYAAFVLSAAARAEMLRDLAGLLERQAGSTTVVFAMPVNRLWVTLG